MISLRKPFPLIILLLLILLSQALRSQNLRTWDVYEITLKSSVTFENPHTEGLRMDNKAFLIAEFTGTDGECTGFRFQWTDLVNQKEAGSGTVNGGSIVEIKCPEDYPGTVNYKDWVLYIRLNDQ